MLFMSRFKSECLERAARGIGLYVNTDKTFQCLKEDGAIFTVNKSTEFGDYFKYFNSNISSTEIEFNIPIGKA